MGKSSKKKDKKQDKKVEKEVNQEQNQPVEKPHTRFDRLDFFILLGICIFALGLRIYGLSKPSKDYFDEIHYVPAARDYLTPDKQDRNDIHPPLAKEIMAVFIYFGGDDPSVKIDEIKDWPAFIVTLRGHRRPAVNRVWEMLDDDTKNAVMSWKPTDTPGRDIKMAVVRGLNGILPKREFYNPEAFKKVDFRERKTDDEDFGKAEAMLTKGVGNLTEKELRKFNRYLFEAIWPKYMELCKFGGNAVSWRLPGVLLGMVMIVIAYLFGIAMFKSRFCAIVSAFLLSIEFLHIVQTRIATLDIYIAAFVFIGFYFTWLYIDSKPVKREGRPDERPLKYLLWAAFFFGCSLAVKLSGLAAAAGAFLFITIVFLIESLKDEKIPDDTASLTTGTLIFALLAPIAAILNPISPKQKFLLQLVSTIENYSAEASNFAGLALFIFIALLFRRVAVNNKNINPKLIKVLEYVIIAGAVIMLLATMGNLFVLIIDVILIAALLVSAFVQILMIKGVPKKMLDDGFRLTTVALVFAGIMFAVFMASHIPLFIKGEKDFNKRSAKAVSMGAKPISTGDRLKFYRDKLTFVRTFRFHYTDKFTHPYLSHMWQWPTVHRPIWYLWEKNERTKIINGIVAIGCLLFWWSFIPVLFDMTVRAFKKKDIKLIFILCAYYTLYFFWLSSLSNHGGYWHLKGGFFYYIFPCVPFMVLGLTETLADLRDSKVGKISIAVYLVGLVIFLIGFYPILSGIPFHDSWFEKLMKLNIFKSWL